MATNNSPYAIHVTDEDGNPATVLPGDDIPGHVKVDNPLVKGKESAEESADKPVRGRRSTS